MQNSRSGRTKTKAYNRKPSGLVIVLGLSVAGLVTGNLFGREPHFLDHGDDAVLVAPRANFEIELERLSLMTSRFGTVPDGELNYAAQAASGEASDLAAALKKAKVSEADAKRIQSAHSRARAALRELAQAAEIWPNWRGREENSSANDSGSPSTPLPRRPALILPQDLPAEFADYLEGALVWHDPAVTDKAAARAAWERLLERAPNERHWKSTWAAFMLGRSWETNQPEKAITYFQKVRDLARHGFVDSINLAAASLGLEARVRLQQKDYERAIELYLEQYAAGDGSACCSLAFAAAPALRSGPQILNRLAANGRTQRLLTSFLISSRFRRLSDSENEADPDALAAEKNWLAAAEAAEVKDHDSAEKLAWIAYRCNELECAKRWLKLAFGSPASQWLEAKLLMREGKLGPAEAILAQCAEAFPIYTSTNDPPPASLSDNLFVCHYYADTPAGRQVRGELGVVRLARGEYPEALEAFLKGGFWMDAAYLAERVLTVDELKSYVDQNWPRVSERQIAQEKEKYQDEAVAPYHLREQIRFLLARRLTRSFRGDVAREYYPAEWVTQFDFLAQALRVAWDASVPTNDRAVAFIQAAFITRTNGMELLGTEVEPDWHIRGGDTDYGVCWQDRATNHAESKIVRARPEEIRRAVEHSANPERRFHYRYQAALLAWEASKLMPNESDQTAFVLCKAGSWLKGQDPEVADILYKSLVRRNRKTALGAAADVRRWFPDIDDQGNMPPSYPVAIAENADSEQSESGSNDEDSGVAAGLDPEIEDLISEISEAVDADSNADSAENRKFAEYVVEKGDSLASIAYRFQLSIEDLLELNPGQEQARLKVGQRLRLADLNDSPPAKSYDVEYEVRPGDTLSEIARAYTKSGLSVSVRQILAANPGVVPERIVAGQKIVIPTE